MNTPSTKPVLILGNSAKGPRNGRDPKVLNYLPSAPERNINIGLPKFVHNLQHIPPRTLDLLEIAAYVFAADRLIKRGRKKAVEYHSWSRSFDFYVRVRDFSFWSNDSVKQKLEDLLQFMTGDASIKFYFEPGHQTPPEHLFDRSDFSIETIDEQLPTVTLFSGGIDSLAGALERLADTNEKVILASHQSQSATTRTQRALVNELKQKYPNRVDHYSFECTLRKCRAAEETQRTRSFLYASIGYAIASACNSSDLFVYENGVTSINLPRREDLANARASRTTHPKTIHLLSEFFSLLKNSTFNIRTPYLFCTKRDVIEKLCNKAPQLLPSTVSCTQTFKIDSQATHCGHCFQCIDRRIASYAAGVQDRDYRGLYVHDIVAESINDRMARTTAVDYVRQANHFKEWNLDRFQYEHLNDLADLFDFLPQKGTDAEQVEMVWKLLRRHGVHVSQGFRNMQLRFEPLQPPPHNSMLALVTSGEHIKSEVERLVESISRIVSVAVGEMFSRNRPQNETDLNMKLSALVRTHEPDLESEHPTKSFACASVVPDHLLQSSDLLLESKYIRRGTSPSKATEGIAADLTKYPENAFILFIVYDPDHMISSDDQYCKKIEAKGRNKVIIVR